MLGAPTESLYASLASDEEPTMDNEPIMDHIGGVEAPLESTIKPAGTTQATAKKAAANCTAQSKVLTKQGKRHETNIGKFD